MLAGLEAANAVRGRAADGRHPRQPGAGRERRGARAAAEVFERVLRELGAAATPRRRGAERVRLAQLRTAAARTIDLYGQLLQSALEAYADLAAGALAPGARRRPTPALARCAGARRATDSSAPVWVHNLTDAPQSSPSCSLTELVAPGRRTLATAAAFRPAGLRGRPPARAARPRCR